MSTILLVIGVLVAIVGGIQFLILAFREHILWGIGCLVFWPIAIAFVLNHWYISKGPFLTHVAGLVIVVFAGMVAGIQGGPEPL